MLVADIHIRAFTGLALVGATTGQGVHPREPVQLAGTSISNSKAPSLGGPSIASSGDTSAVVWVDESDDGLYVSVSDGRGLSWSAPLRADEAVTPSTKYLRRQAVVVADGFVTMMWGDQRDGSWDVYSNVLHVPTMSFAGEQRVSTTYAPGESDAGQFADIANGGDGFGGFVYVVFGEVNEMGESLYLASSSEYGLHFGDPVPLAVEQFPAGSLTVWSPALDADGMSVFVGWLDNRHDPQIGVPRDVFLQWSHEAGLPGTFQDDPKRLDTDGPGVGNPEVLSIDVAEDMVAAVWHNKTGFALFDDEVHCRVSPDGGASFGDDVVVNPDIALANLYMPKVAINPTACAVHVGWIDDSPTSYLGHGLFTRASTDCVGTFWGAPMFELNANVGVDINAWPNWGFAVERSANVDATVSAYWWDSSAFDWTPSLRGRIAEGTSGGWTTRFTVAEDVASEGWQWISTAYNALYRNFLYAWRGREGIVEIGGYRPQTLSPAGWEPGEATVSFSLDRFEASNDSTAWVLMSLEQGDLIDLGGKVLGLLPDPLLTASVGVAADGTWAAELDGEGAGSTSELETVLPAGVSLYAVGIGLDLQAMTVDVGSITDAMEIEL